jgi:hypothetical protein
VIWIRLIKHVRCRLSSDLSRIIRLAKSWSCDCFISMNSFRTRQYYKHDHHVTRRHNVDVHSTINFVWFYDYDVHKIEIFQFVFEFADEVYLKSLLDEFVSLVQSCVVELCFDMMQFKHAQYYVDIVVFVNCIKNCFENAFLLLIVEQTSFYQINVVTIYKLLFYVRWFRKITDNEYHV